MKAEEFLKEVMHRGGLSSRLEAQDAVRATLETLSEHLTGGEAANLLSQLPPELGAYLQQPELKSGESLSRDEFFTRVSQREQVGVQEASHHVSAVASVLSEAVSQGEMQDICQQLPADLAALFQPQNQSSTS